MKTFRIATYNVNSIRSRLHIVIPWLKENRPDVLCMQETKVNDPEFPALPFEEIGYHVVFRGDKRYNGVACASLNKPSSVHFGLDDAGPADGDRLIRAVYSGVAVLNSYVPQGRERETEHYAYKLDWYKRFKNLLEKAYAVGDPLIWCGDLNVAPESIDVHDPKRLLGHVCFNPDVWDAFASVKAWGLSDIFRKHYPGKPGLYTFFDYRVPKSVERGLGWRIDHILATPALAEKSTGCSIDLKPRLSEKPSDHTILTAEFSVMEDTKAHG